MSLTSAICRLALATLTGLCLVSAQATPSPHLDQSAAAPSVVAGGGCRGACQRPSAVSVAAPKSIKPQLVAPRTPPNSCLQQTCTSRKPNARGAAVAYIGETEKNRTGGTVPRKG